MKLGNYVKSILGWWIEDSREVDDVVDGKPYEIFELDFDESFSELTGIVSNFGSEVFKKNFSNLIQPRIRTIDPLTISWRSRDFVQFIETNYDFELQFLIDRIEDHLKDLLRFTNDFEKLYQRFHHYYVAYSCLFLGGRRAFEQALKEGPQKCLLWNTHQAIRTKEREMCSGRIKDLPTFYRPTLILLPKSFKPEPLTGEVYERTLRSYHPHLLPVFQLALDTHEVSLHAFMALYAKEFQIVDTPQGKHYALPFPSRRRCANMQLPDVDNVFIQTAFLFLEDYLFKSLEDTEVAFDNFIEKGLQAILTSLREDKEDAIILNHMAPIMDILASLRKALNFTLVAGLKKHKKKGWLWSSDTPSHFYKPFHQHFLQETIALAANIMRRVRADHDKVSSMRYWLKEILPLANNSFKRMTGLFSGT